MDKKIENMDFTGGDNLQGIELIYHRIMKKNELLDGKGAYKLSFAEKGNSGPSFGGNQMDLAANPEARKIFLEVVKHAKNPDDTNILSSSDVKKLEDILSKPKDMIGRKVDDIFEEKLEKKLNSALSSEYGIKKINEAYVKEIKERGAMVEKEISKITNPQAKAFYDTDQGRALLFDFKNQYSPKNKILDYINGEPVTLKPVINIAPERVVQCDTDRSYTIDDHTKFLKNLPYALSGNLRDVDRRLENIELTFKELPIKSPGHYSFIGNKQENICGSLYCSTGEKKNWFDPYKLTGSFQSINKQNIPTDYFKNPILDSFISGKYSSFNSLQGNLFDPFTDWRGNYVPSQSLT